jgi:hypothetical protein
MTKKEDSSESKGLRKETVEDLDAPDEKAGDVKGGADTRPVRPTTALPTPPVRPDPTAKNPRTS